MRNYMIEIGTLKSEMGRKGMYDPGFVEELFESCNGGIVFFTCIGIWHYFGH